MKKKKAFHSPKLRPSCLLNVALFFGIAGILLLIIILLILVTDESIFIITGKIDLLKANYVGGFVGGLVGVFISISGVIFLYLNFVKQQEQFKVNSTETSLFNMLNLLKQTVCELTTKTDSGTEVSGSVFFEMALNELNVQIKDSIVDNKYKENRFNTLFNVFSNTGKNAIRISKQQVDIDVLKEYLSDVYDKFYPKYSSQLGHYFRFVYNIIKFIDLSEIDTARKEKYINLIQAQMSSDELGLIFYNGLNWRGKRLHPFLEDYKFLENIDLKSLYIPELFAKLYPKNSFHFMELIDDYIQQSGGVDRIDLPLDNR